MDKGINFLDIEANQDIYCRGKPRNMLLQIGAIRISNDGKISEFNEYVKYFGKINKKVKFILGKNEAFFRNHDFQIEQAVYNKFANFCKGYTSYSYGNYDKFVLDEASSRTKENKIIDVIDISCEISSKLKLDNSVKPSLSMLMNVFSINRENEHDALNDSLALYEIYKKLYNKDINIDMTKNKLILEFMRPRWENKLSKLYIKNIVEEQKITKDYLVIFNESIIEKNIIDEDKSSFTSIVDIRIYNNDLSLLQKVKEKSTFENKDEAREYVYKFYNEYIFEYSNNFVMVYDNKKLSFSEFYKRKTKNLFLYHNISKSKIDLFIEHFEIKGDKEDQDKIIIKIINDFYNSNDNKFSNPLKYEYDFIK